MVQQHGLGRGLASLIPPKRDDTTKESPFKDMVLRAVEKESFPSAVVIKPMSEKMNPQVSDSAPLPVPEADTSSQRVEELPVGSIVPNPHQPRLQFDDAKLRELADSIREHGILQPLSVTKLSEGKYELIAGERRLEAARLAGLSTVPAIVREAGEKEKLELSIIENIQRHDLNPIEEAKAYARLADEFGLHQDAVAKKMGKSRSVVANTLRLLQLPVDIQRAIAEGKISEGHAKALLSIENPEKQRALFELILKDGLTVRGTETKAREISVRPYVRHLPLLTPELAEKSEQLSHILGTKVSLKPSGKGGRIVVEYFSDEELDGILKKISGE
jgi:ParB family chromosome partitioning protein